MAGGAGVPRSRWCAGAAGTAQIVFPLANDVTELLEEGFQLLLLSW